MELAEKVTLLEFSKAGTTGGDGSDLDTR